MILTVCDTFKIMASSRYGKTAFLQIIAFDSKVENYSTNIE